MATSLSVTGNTRITWGLSDAQSIGSASQSAEHKTSRTITHGTGPSQANLAWSKRYSITGVGSVSVGLGLPVSNFGAAGTATLTKAKEVLVTVATGPTGGYVTFGMPTGITGARVAVGGQLHWADYLSGLSMSTGTFDVVNGPTGTYSVDITVIGIGSYS